MANCRACGGKLGLNCFNEQDCLEISNRQYYQDEQIIYQLEEYIEILKYRLLAANITIPSIIITEIPLVFNPLYLCVTKPMVDDYFPF
jgi:hypothetical protein